MTIGQRIAKARMNAGLSQETLAAAMNTHQSAISRMEGDRQEPTVSEFKRLGELLGVRPGWLAFGVQRKPRKEEQANGNH